MRKIIHLVLLTIFAACSEIDLMEQDLPFKTVSLAVKNYCPNDGNTFLDMGLVNMSYLNNFGQLQADTDRDGLSDIEEVNNAEVYNTSSTNRHSFDNNLSDFFNISILGPNSALLAVRNCNIIQDSDNDFLDDCEEELIGTDPNNPDSDGDLIIDGLEVRYGLNPLDPNDASLDPDGDGVSNLDEIRNGTDIYTYNDSFQNLVKLEYNINQIVDSNCYEISVGNIQLVNVENGNLLKIYVLEKNDQDKVSVRYENLLVSKNLQPESKIVINNISNQSQVIENVNGDLNDED